MFYALSTNTIIILHLHLCTLHKGNKSEIECRDVCLASLYSLHVGGDPVQPEESVAHDLSEEPIIVNPTSHE